MNPHLRPKLPALLVAAVLALVVASPLLSQGDAPVRPEHGEPIPDFRVWDELNVPVASKSWADGTPFLVDFWATWCGPCKFTLPELEKIHQEYDGRLQVYGISVDSGAGGGFRARNFAKEGGAHYPILHDLRAEARRATGVNVLPVLFLYDGEGKLVGDWWGEPDFEAVREAIEGVVEPVDAEGSDAEEGDADG